MEFLTSLPIEVKGALFVLMLYIGDVIVTKTADPRDNIIWRAIKTFITKRR